MLTKTVFALALLVAAGGVSAALADEVPENKIGDRYPQLEQRYVAVPSVPTFAGTSSFASAARPTTHSERALAERFKGLY